MRKDKRRQRNPHCDTDDFINLIEANHLISLCSNGYVLSCLVDYKKWYIKKKTQNNGAGA